MVRHKKRHHGLRLRSLFLWHRYFGLAAAAFVLILAVTGFALNHGERLQLAQRHVQATWLLNWYGISAAAISAAFAVNSHWVSQAGGHIYWDDRELDLAAPLQGAVALADGAVIATPTELLWLTARGDTVAKLGKLDGLPTDIAAVGLDGNRVALRTTHGAYRGDEELLNWTATPAGTVQWAASLSPPEALLAKVTAAQRGAGLTVERVMLDLHSGRLFGRYGPYVMDGAAVLMVLLALTGVWHWAQRKRR